MEEGCGSGEQGGESGVCGQGVEGLGGEGGVREGESMEKKLVGGEKGG